MCTNYTVIQKHKTILHTNITGNRAIFAEITVSKNKNMIPGF